MTVLVNGRYSHDYLNGVLVKETLNPANEIVNRGHYAATTLSAVDADLAVANIKNAVNIFGFVGTFGGGIETIERYYTADIANGAFYTPAAEGLFSAVLEIAKLRVELLDGNANWWDILEDGAYKPGNTSVVGDGTNLRFGNGDGSARNLIIMRHYVSTGTYERNNTQDLAAGATYTPAETGLFSMAAESPSILETQYKYNAAWWGWWEFDSGALPGSTYLAIGDGTNLRYKNTHGSVACWIVVMRAKIVT